METKSESKIVLLSTEIKNDFYQFKLGKIGVKGITSKELSFLKDNSESIKEIYITKKIFDKNPDIIERIINSIPILPKIIIDKGENIREEIAMRYETEKENKIPSEIKAVFTDFLYKCGFKRKLKGTLYLEYTFYLLYMDENNLLNIKKNIYMEIGRCFKTGDDSVERNIAFAIRKAFEKSRAIRKENLFSHMEKSPTNSEFITEAYRELKKII